MGVAGGFLKWCSSPVSLKDLADLSLDGTHWLLRVAQQEDSCAGVGREMVEWEHGNVNLESIGGKTNIPRVWELKQYIWRRNYCSSRLHIHSTKVLPRVLNWKTPGGSASFFSHLFSLVSFLKQQTNLWVCCRRQMFSLNTWEKTPWKFNDGRWFPSSIISNRVQMDYPSAPPAKLT